MSAFPPAPSLTTPNGRRPRNQVCFEWSTGGYHYRVRIPRTNPVFEYWTRDGWLKLPPERMFPAAMMLAAVGGLGLVARKAAVVETIADILWPDGDMDHEWSSNEIEEIAAIVGRTTGRTS